MMFLHNTANLLCRVELLWQKFIFAIAQFRKHILTAMLHSQMNTVCLLLSSIEFIFMCPVLKSYQFFYAYHNSSALLTCSLSDLSSSAIVSNQPCSPTHEGSCKAG